MISWQDDGGKSVKASHSGWFLGDPNVASHTDYAVNITVMPQIPR